jgi:hypothetical protein
LKKAQAINCIACETETTWFVAILKNNSGGTYEKHWYVCLHCYEEDKWQTVTRTKELTTKSGSSNGSRKRASKRKGNPSQAAWEESIQATSSSNSSGKNWWEK